MYITCPASPDFNSEVTIYLINFFICFSAFAQQARHPLNPLPGGVVINNEGIGGSQGKFFLFVFILLFFFYLSIKNFKSNIHSFIQNKLLQIKAYTKAFAKY